MRKEALTGVLDIHKPKLILQVGKLLYLLAQDFLLIGLLHLLAGLFLLMKLLSELLLLKLLLLLLLLLVLNQLLIHVPTQVEHCQRS